MSTKVRVELIDILDENQETGKKLLIDNGIVGRGYKQIEVTAEALGYVKPDEPCSAAISKIVSNGNIRFGVCDVEDTNRFEITPARYAKLEFKMGDEVKPVTHIVFKNFLDTGNIEIVECGENFRNQA